jgi:hypothetical protein
MKLLQLLKQRLTPQTDSEYVYQYLSDSVSLEDLERRQRELRLRGYIA